MTVGLGHFLIVAALLLTPGMTFLTLSLIGDAHSRGFLIMLLVWFWGPLVVGLGRLIALRLREKT
jgi:hypothetical protein